MSRPWHWYDCLACKQTRGITNPICQHTNKQCVQSVPFQREGKLKKKHASIQIRMRGDSESACVPRSKPPFLSPPFLLLWRPWLLSCVCRRFLVLCLTSFDGCSTGCPASLAAKPTRKVEKENVCVRAFQESLPFLLLSFSPPRHRASSLVCRPEKVARP